MLTTEELWMVTVTYGERADLLGATLLSAYRAGVRRIVLVSNGSPAYVVHSARGLLDNRPDLRIEVVLLAHNLGSAGGFRAGIERALSVGAQWLWLLDDDNEVHPNALLELEKVANSSNEMSAFASLRSSSSLHINACRDGSSEAYPPPGSFLSFDLLHRAVLWARPTRTRLALASGTVGIPYGPYGGLLISNAIISQIGLPDTRLGLYEDDTEFTSRIVYAGVAYRLVCESVVADLEPKWSVGVRHARGPGRLLNASSTDRFYFAVRNRVYFDKRRASTPGRRLRLVANAAVYFVVVAVSSLRAQDRGRMVRFGVAVAHGWRGDFRLTLQDLT